MASLDIAERRLPQDGRIQLNMKGKGIDLRVSTLPTVFGESVVMRILDKSIVMLDLEHVGLSKNDVKLVEEIIKKPNGVVLATGPTGCGKTTTLYSCLKILNDIDVKIITTEDPVEYDIPGIVQVQIKEHIGLTFAICLRHILRQDPDKILVGEIRDKETADMTLETIGLKPGDAEGKSFYRGKGCDGCKNIGYLGRTGIFEVLVLNEEVRSLILERAPTKDLRAAAEKGGMRNLREDGLEKIFAGITSIEEVAREAMGRE
jgi:type IV pilus assembly protein PilB